MNKGRDITTKTESRLGQLGQFSAFDTEVSMEYNKLGGPGEKVAWNIYYSQEWIGNG